MTCVVAVRGPGGVSWMGADSQSSGCYMKHDLSPAMAKIFAKGDLLIGVSGSVRFHNLLRFHFDPPAHHPADKDILDYMVLDVAEAIRHIAKDLGYTQIENAVETMESQALILYRGMIFVLWGDFHIGQYDSEYHAIGSGAEVATGALYAMEFSGENRVRDRVRIALEAAAKHSVGVGAPFVFLEQSWPSV